MEASHTLWTMDNFVPPPNTEEMIAEEAELRNKTLSSQTRKRRRQPRQEKEEGAEVTEDAVIGEEDEALPDEDNSTGYYPFVMKVRSCSTMYLSLIMPLTLFPQSFRSPLFSLYSSYLVSSTWKCRLGCCLHMEV